MKPPSHRSTLPQVPHPTATFKADFRRKQGGRAPDVISVPAGIPRIASLLALAHRIAGMIRSGELKNWAEAARLIGITRARMTQIADLLLLAPHLQASLLGINGATLRRASIAEAEIRSRCMNPCWVEQEPSFWSAALRTGHEFSADTPPAPLDGSSSSN